MSEKCQIAAIVGRRLAERPRGRRRAIALLRRLWHGRGMMVDNKPVLAVLYVSEAVARGEYLCFSVLDVGKRIIAGINRRTAVNADQLIAERNFEAGKNPKGGHEIISQFRSIGTHRRRQRPPEHGVIGIELQYLVGFVFAKRSRPRRGRRRYVFLRSGRSTSSKRQQDNAQCEFRARNLQRRTHDAFSR